MSGGVFITEAGVSKLHEIFNAYQKQDIPEIERIVSEEAGLILKGEDRFDHLYSTLYGLSLLKNDAVAYPEKHEPKEDEMRHWVKIDIDVLDLPEVSSDRSFKDTLLSEYQVADTAGYISRFIHSLDCYEIKLEKIKADSLSLEFAVYAESERETLSKINRRSIGKMLDANCTFEIGIG